MEKNEITETLQLMPKPGREEEKVRGMISFRMKHTPPVLDGVITATVIKANDLADSDHGFMSGKSDPYCVLAFDGEEQAKTSTIDSSKDPEWNETLPPIPVSGAVQAVSFTVMDFDEDTAHDHLGTISFGAEQIIMDRTIQGNFSLGSSPGEVSFFPFQFLFLYFPSHKKKTENCCERNLVNLLKLPAQRVMKKSEILKAFLAIKKPPPSLQLAIDFIG